MKESFAIVIVFVGVNFTVAQKPALIESIDARADQSWSMARKIWEWAEPGYQETKSSALLADALEKAGFKVERGVRRSPPRSPRRSARASRSSASSVSTTPCRGCRRTAGAVPRAREGGNGYGHGCGHHLFGVASRSGAIAIAEQIKAGRSRGRCASTAARRRRAGRPRCSWPATACSGTATSCSTGTPAAATRAGDALPRPYRGQVPLPRRRRPRRGLAGEGPFGTRRPGALTSTPPSCSASTRPDGTRIHHSSRGGGASAERGAGVRGGLLLRAPPKAETVRSSTRGCSSAPRPALATETKLEIVHLGGTMELLPNEALARWRGRT